MRSRSFGNRSRLFLNVRRLGHRPLRSRYHFLARQGTLLRLVMLVDLIVVLVLIKLVVLIEVELIKP
jgi:hypothetical protein